MEKPLSSIRVLDLSRLLPGPFCSLILSDMGAEVIRVEDPDNVDQVRILGANSNGENVTFDTLNRGKQSVAIRMKHAQGRAAFLKLVEKADVVIEGFRPGYMERRELGYNKLKNVNPKLVYCSLSGFGQSGPYRDKGGHDVTYQALAGTLITRKDDPNEIPALPPVLWGDLAAGSLTAAMSILAAIVHVRSGGAGRHIDAPILDGLLLLNSMGMATASLRGRDTERGERMVNGDLACYGIYQTRDGGYIALGCLEPGFWQAFCNLIGRTDLLPLHTDLERQDELRKELQTIFLSKTRDEWVEFSKDTDCCLESVYSPTESIRHPHVISRGHLYPIKSGSTFWNAPGVPPGLMGQLQDAGSNASLLDETQYAPRFGEHTREILKEIGFSDSEIRELADNGAVTV